MKIPLYIIVVYMHVRLRVIRISYYIEILNTLILSRSITIE